MPLNNRPLEQIRKCSAAGTRAFKACILASISPTSTNEDERRKELILNIILVISLFFLSLLDIMVIWHTLATFPHYHGIHWIIFTSIIGVCAGMLWASKHGYARHISYILISIYGMGALYGGWHWGASLPAILLSFALISVTSSILVSTRFGFIISGLIIMSLTVLAIHEIYSVGVLPWKYETITPTDTITYSAILLFIAALSWLSNREIENSLKRARTSENALALERDQLEIKVRERTAQLHQAQAERMIEVSQIAEFGRLSQGLFHDLMTPLSTVNLHMEKLRNTDIPEAHEARAYLMKAVDASHKMGNFMNLIREHIKHTSTKSAHPFLNGNSVLILNELNSTLEILKYKIKDAVVTINTHVDPTLIHNGDSLFFRRIFQNIISNAIEAHDSHNAESKNIDVTISKNKNCIEIIITDNGPGISPENLKHIFEPFFSTKLTQQGMGVGLSAVKSIVERDLRGVINVSSIPYKETKFTIIIPAQ